MPVEKLLQDFPPVATEVWEDAISKDLKEADYAKKLVWKAEDEISIKPYYRSEDLAGLPHLQAEPGEFPYVRGTRSTGSWGICEEVQARSVEEANRFAQEAIHAGAEEIAFRDVPIKSAEELGVLCASLGNAPIHFRETDESLLQVLLKSAMPTMKSSDWDPSSDFDLAATAVNSAGRFRPFAVQSNKLDGATTVQEVGFSIAAGIDYLAEMQTRDVDVNLAASSLIFSVSIGSNYFFQIAKLRALRTLWALAVASFGGSKESAKAVIHAKTSAWNKTIYDPHVNVLRATTEAMSAALGGADVITVTPFDAPYKQPDAATRRLGRNTQIILKAEAYLDRVADAGGGSYYVEHLTDLICRKSWEVVQKIEAAGGYKKASAIIDAEVAKSLKAADDAVASRRTILLGTNQYPNLSEKALPRIEVEDDAHRGAKVFEKIRLRTELHCGDGKKCPRFLLAMVGERKMSTARAAFAANFFGCAGFDVVTQHFESVYDLSVVNVDVIVLCSSDDEYLALADRLMTVLKALAQPVPVIIAGNPETKEQLKQLGVAGFVHLRSNIVETLEDWQRRLGINDASGKA